jgi:hypothetical protein
MRMKLCRFSGTKLTCLTMSGTKRTRFWKYEHRGKSIDMLFMYKKDRAQRNERLICLEAESCIKLVDRI